MRYLRPLQLPLVYAQRAKTPWGFLSPPLYFCSLWQSFVVVTAFVLNILVASIDYLSCRDRSSGPGLVEDQDSMHRQHWHLLRLPLLLHKRPSHLEDCRSGQEKPVGRISEISDKGIAKGGVKNRNKGGCKRLFAFVHVCSRLLTFSLCICLRLSAFVCVCLRLLAFAYAPPLLRPPLRDTEAIRARMRKMRKSGLLCTPLLHWVPFSTQKAFACATSSGGWHLCFLTSCLRSWFLNIA